MCPPSRWATPSGPMAIRPLRPKAPSNPTGIPSRPTTKERLHFLRAAGRTAALDVPLALVRRDGIKAPVQEDAELAIAEPSGMSVCGPLRGYCPIAIDTVC